MKPGFKYLKNPVPFAMTVANPKGGKRKAIKKTRRNPAKARSAGAGVFVIRSPKRNPIMKKSRRKVAKKRRNPATRVKRAAVKRRRPAVKRRRNVAKKRRKISSVFSRNPMKTRKRRRGSRRSRNPMARSGAKRRSGRRSSRRRSRSFMRNPFPMVKDVFSSDILATTGGVLGGSVFANTVISKLVMGDATGKRAFNLPGVDYSMLLSTDPLVKQTFYTKNAWALGLYKAVVGAGTGLALRKYSPRLGAGVIAGGLLAAVTTVLQANNLITPAGTLASRGTSRNYPAARNGTGVYLPGVNPMFTGQASAFLTPNVPQLNPRGTGAQVNRRFMQALPGMVERPFAN